jgi:hypothetical protein
MSDQCGRLREQHFLYEHSEKKGKEREREMNETMKDPLCSISIHRRPEPQQPPQQTRQLDPPQQQLRSRSITPLLKQGMQLRL